MFAHGHFEKSREYYQEALIVEAACSEAQYNLGLSLKKLGRYQEALDCFLKLHSILKNSPQVIYHVADLHDKQDDVSAACEWFMQLISLVPTDPRLLQRLGEMYDGENDRPQAFHYHFEVGKVMQCAFVHNQIEDALEYTVEPLNIVTFGTSYSVHYREVPFFGGY